MSMVAEELRGLLKGAAKRRQADAHVLRILCVTLIWPAIVRADQAERHLGAELKDLAAGVRELVEDDEAVGAEVLVLERRQVVLHEAFGWSDADRRTPLRPNTIVCVRSMTKPLVGTAIQMLIDDGKLGGSGPRSKYLRSFDNDKSRAVTIDQLLTHTAGFPLTLIDKPLSSYSGQRAIVEEAGRPAPAPSPAHSVTATPIRKRWRRSSPRYRDSPPMSSSAGVSSSQLGMHDTYCVLGKDSPPRMRVSSNHAGAPGLWHKYWDHEAKPFFPYFLGAAVLYATATDYARFLSLWLDRGKVGQHRLLSEAAVECGASSQPSRCSCREATHRSRTGLSPLKPFYGRHWMVYPPPIVSDAKALPVFGHGGSNGTLALVFPERDLIVCYFTQSRGGMSVFRFEELVAPLVGLNRPVLRRRLSLDQVKPLLGDYVETRTGKRAWVTPYRRRLRLELAGQAALLPLWPDDAGRSAFGESSPGVSVSFDKTSSGTVTKMRLMYQDNPLVVFERVTNTSDLPSVQHVMVFRREKQGGHRIDELKSLEIRGKLTVGAIKLDIAAIAASLDRVVRRVVSQDGVVTSIYDGRARVQADCGCTTGRRVWRRARRGETNGSACRGCETGVKAEGRSHRREGPTGRRRRLDCSGRVRI